VAEPQRPQALTLHSKAGLLGEIRTNAKVGTPAAQGVQISTMTNDLSAIWDTGATGSVITQRVVDELGLKPISIALVHGVGGIQESPVFLVNILLPMNVTIGMVRVTLGNLPAGTDVLIGMDVITVGDFVISNNGGRTKMSFRVPSSGDWDFVKDLEAGNRSERRAQEKAERRKRKG
jgi:predicted aspartyl protease